MQKKTLLKKASVVGIILLFIGTCVIPVIAQNIEKQLVTNGNFSKNTNGLHDNNTITHKPDDGLYWNDRKIAEYSVPFYLHYYFRLFAKFYPTFIFNDNVSGISYIEFYVDGVLIGNATCPPWTFTFKVTVTPFHHSLTCGIKVYFYGGQILSDNVTIYRLFP